MTGRELLRRRREYGRRTGVAVQHEPDRGKGSHTTVYLGKRLSVIPDLRRELPPGTFHSILKDLGLRREDLAR